VRQTIEGKPSFKPGHAGVEKEAEKEESADFDVR
jgi:hypothetical protein